jgi:hypothetical protein
VSSPLKKTLNKVKASVAEREGPVRADQDTVPFEDAIRAYWQRGMVVDECGQPGAGTAVDPLPSRRELRTEQAMLPRDAFFARTETVKPKDAVGRVSAELVTPYPPGVPAIAYGEVYTDAVVGYLEEIVANGAYVEGAADASLGTLRVVAE